MLVTVCSFRISKCMYCINVQNVQTFAASVEQYLDYPYLKNFLARSNTLYHNVSQTISLDNIFEDNKKYFH